MHFTPSIRVFATACVLAASGVVCSAQQQGDLDSLRRELGALKRQNNALEQGYKASLERERNASAALNKVRTRLEAMGKGLFTGGDDRLIDAVNEIDTLSVKLQKTEQAALDLSSAINEFLQSAIASNPDARMRVEETIRNLDSVLGMRQKPRPEVALGSLQDARVVSIDSESGMLVFNVGEKTGARIGMTFDILRGDNRIGEAMIIDSRPDVAGAMVQRLVKNNEIVQLGDTASLQTTFE